MLSVISYLLRQNVIMNQIRTMIIDRSQTSLQINVHYDFISMLTYREIKSNAIVENSARIRMLPMNTEHIRCEKNETDCRREGIGGSTMHSNNGNA